ncbi:MAG: M24 family metallopeptidase [Candidatus Promineifilaceae bacterium]|jgi:Xaa-Pro aminopeptidase
MSTTNLQRLQQVRDALPKWQVEGLLVSNPVNCRWLSGFSGSFSFLLVTADKALLATDSRYWIQAAEQAPDFELFQSQRTMADMARFVNATDAAVIGFEADCVTYKQGLELQTLEGISWRPLNQTLEPLRMQKSAEEIALIQAAAAITDAAMTQMSDFLVPGMAEAELAWRLESRMRELGADGMAFPPIVAFGSNSALPHHAPGERKLQEGDIVLVDMGARLKGYHSDLTRTFYYGKKADPKFLEIFDIVLAAHTAAMAKIKAGVNTRETHLAAADVIAEAGYGEHFGHGLGHGLGLEIHEIPFLSATREPQIVVNHSTVTVEPGIYIEGCGGVRIEDLILVTPDGCQAISHCPKKPNLITP